MGYCLLISSVLPYLVVTSLKRDVGGCPRSLCRLDTASGLKERSCIFRRHVFWVPAILGALRPSASMNAIVVSLQICTYAQPCYFDTCILRPCTQPYKAAEALYKHLSHSRTVSPQFCAAKPFFAGVKMLPYLNPAHSPNLHNPKTTSTTSFCFAHGPPSVQSHVESHPKPWLRECAQLYLAGDLGC